MNCGSETKETENFPRLKNFNLNIILTPNIYSKVEAFVSDHLWNSKKWSKQELVAYKNELL